MMRRANVKYYFKILRRLFYNWSMFRSISVWMALSSCATHFEYAPCLPPSCKPTPSSRPSLCLPISSWASPFVSLPAHACLTFSWWYPPFPFATPGPTISVVSFSEECCHCLHAWLLSAWLHAPLMWSFLVLPLAHLYHYFRHVCSLSSGTFVFSVAGIVFVQNLF